MPSRRAAIPQPVGAKVDAVKATLLASSDYDRALLRKACLEGTPPGFTWTTATAALIAALPEPERVFILGWLRKWVRQDGTIAEPRLEPLPTTIESPPPATEMPALCVYLCVPTRR